MNVCYQGMSLYAYTSDVRLAVDVSDWTFTPPLICISVSSGQKFAKGLNVEWWLFSAS